MPRPGGSGARPPLWRDVRVLAWVFQLVVAGLVLALLWWLVRNLQVNSSRQNIPLSFDFLAQPAGFPIADNQFRTSQPVQDAFVVGLGNTLLLAVVGIVASTVLGIVLGVARLSRNLILQRAAQVYVEVVRNVPLLVLMVLGYVALVLNALPPPVTSWRIGPLAVVNVRGTWIPWFVGNGLLLVALSGVALVAGFAAARWRVATADRTGAPARSGLWALAAITVVVLVGWVAGGYGVTLPVRAGRGVQGGMKLSPTYLAALGALVIYTSSHIAEITRGSIQAVPRGQGEAADALALSGFQRMWFVVLPQAMRIAVPPVGNQYLNLTKNSSLAAVIAFPELTKVTQLTVGNRSPAVPAFLLLLAIYLSLSLAISVLVNLANRRLAVVER